MNEFDERREDDAAPREESPRDEAPREEAAQAAQPGAPREPRPFSAQGGDFRDRPRRRGRRGRGGAGGQRFGAPPRGPMPPRGPLPPRDDEESSQARELAAYERRQQAQRSRGWRGPGWVPGAGPATGAPGGGTFRPQTAGGFRGPRPMGGRGGRRPTGAAYAEQIRRVTAGPRSGAAPSHEAGEPIAGPHAILEAIRAGRQVKRLFVSNERGTRTGPVNELLTEAQERRIFVRFVDPLEIQRLSPIESHQGVVAIAEGKAGVELEELLLHLDTLNEPALVLAIDSLQDPQNFGVLLRSGEGAGVDGVIIPKHRAVGLTPAVAKTSAGASEHLMIAEVANLRQAIDTLKEKGIWVVGTDETGELLYDEVDYRGATAIVIGGEGEGIRRLVLEGCDQVVRIPMEGQVASLNASAAGTVILYEALRQRRRNVAPADTRTPPPVRAEALTPQEETMAGEDVETDEDAAIGADADVIEADGGKVLPVEAVDEAAHEPEAPDEAAEEGAEPEPIAEAPKKRAPRAKKATTPRKSTTRTKPAG
ncbi:MAG TPA: 23S rRNA (guanosine(2251)-2'-O)-methyltransferase RlmB [Candidatus Limnocylindria bacterium]|nr:23S rRNA (guanosine(2251)-2'-O)-methyltransferase RlmB [Candidatus Limnocylindria bacterium]